VTEAILQAISSKRLLSFDYHGLPRVCEPHVCGTLDGEYQALMYQTGGESSTGGLPNWRRVMLDEMSNLVVLEDRFPGRRECPSGLHSSFDQILGLVD
jgi:hypothetical protein